MGGNREIFIQILTFCFYLLRLSPLSELANLIHIQWLVAQRAPSTDGLEFFREREICYCCLLKNDQAIY